MDSQNSLDIQVSGYPIIRISHLYCEVSVFSPGTVREIDSQGYKKIGAEGAYIIYTLEKECQSAMSI